VITVYSEHIKLVHNYVNSIDSLIFDITTKYKIIYKTCYAYTDGLSKLNFIGNIIIVILRQLETLKRTWYIYGLQLNSFLDNFKQAVSLFVMRVY